MTFSEQESPELQLPGGGMDPGESPLRALHREVLEETGWRISPSRRLGAYRRFTFMEDYGFWAEKICHVYAASPVRRLGPPTEPHHSAIWLPPEIAVKSSENEGERLFLRTLFA